MIYFDSKVPRKGYRWIHAELRDIFTDDKLGHQLVLIQNDPKDEGKTYHPIEQHTGLFRIFADTDITKTGILEFANKYGTLEHVTREGAMIGDALFPVDAVPFDAWKDEILSMRQVIALSELIESEWIENPGDYFEWRGTYIHGKDIYYDKKRGDIALSPSNIPARRMGDEGPPRSYKIIFTPHEIIKQFTPGDVIGPAKHLRAKILNSRLEGRVSPKHLWNPSATNTELYFVPRSLIGAVWMQCSLSLNKKSYAKCEQCGDWFEIEEKLMKRAIKYCSNACKSKAWRERKKQKEAS